MICSTLEKTVSVATAGVKTSEDTIAKAYFKLVLVVTVEGLG